MNSRHSVAAGYIFVQLQSEIFIDFSIFHSHYTETALYYESYDSSVFFGWYGFDQSKSAEIKYVRYTCKTKGRWAATLLSLHCEVSFGGEVSPFFVQVVFS